VAVTSPAASFELSGDLLPLAVALGIGLLLGVERERRKGRGPERDPAGIRTFALVGLLGGIAEQLGNDALVAVLAGFVGLAALLGYLLSRDEDPGLTTEVALVVTFLLGALAQRETATAAAIAVAVGLVLTYRERVHHLVRDTLSEQEVHDGLLMAAAALIVLPLVPNEGVGPNDALNPFVVWELVVIVMAVQAAGYVALRVVGPRYGLLFSGLVSGFVSATLTVATMGTRATDEPKLLRPSASAAVVSTVGTVVLLAIVLAATSVETLREVAVPLLLAGLAAGGYATIVAAKVIRAPEPEDFDRGRAFEFKTAVILAVAVSLVLLLTGALNELVGVRGVTLGTALAGFADSQSAAVSAAALVAAGKLSAAQAAVPVLAALTTNTITKAVLAYTAGPRRYAADVSIGLVLMLLAAWVGWAATEALG